MKFLDFFAGIGTIRIGFEQAGWQCSGHVEWDKFAQASYKAMHDIKDGEYCGWDIRSVRADELPRSELWTFGAPCQDFSIAGKRKGMDGERSSLINEIFRLIEETPEENKPTWLLYENVKGMLSSNGGWDFLGILLEMDRLGYDVEWQLLNSKHFGVPQNRERVFTLGHLRGRGGRKVFPVTREGGTDDAEINQIGNLIDTDSFGGNPHRGRLYGTDGISPCLNTMGGGGREPKIVIGSTRCLNSKDKDGKQPSLNDRVYDPRGIHPAVTTSKFFMPNVAIPVLTPDRAEKRQNGRRFKEDGDPMFTLTAQDRHGVAILRPKRTDYGKQIRKQYEAGEVEESRHNMTTLEPVFDGISNTISTVQKDNLLLDNRQGMRIRKLTPKECWRLQGIPDHYFEKASAVNSDSQLYKQAGNACTVNVIYEIAKRIGKGKQHAMTEDNS